MIDGSVIAGYLALSVARGVDRMVSNKIDSLLAGLALRIRNKMGIGPSRDLRANPGDPQIQDMIAHATERRAGRQLQP